MTLLDTMKQIRPNETPCVRVCVCELWTMSPGPVTSYERESWFKWCRARPWGGALTRPPCPHEPNWTRHVGRLALGWEKHCGGGTWCSWDRQDTSNQHFKRAHGCCRTEGPCSWKSCRFQDLFFLAFLWIDEHPGAAVYTSPVVGRLSLFGW